MSTTKVVVIALVVSWTLLTLHGVFVHGQEQQAFRELKKDFDQIIAGR